MTSRNWVRLFMTTLLVGGFTTGIVGFIVRWNEFQPIFSGFNIIEILSVFAWLLGVGLIFSILSQMGFFAYLTVHRFGLGIFKSVFLWNIVQIIITVVVLIDLVYLRYKTFAKADESVLPYIGLAFLVLAVSIVVAFVKMRQTTKTAFIPALFFMVVITILEWVPVLRVNEESWLYLMLFPLLACNAYQLLALHKINASSELERQRKKQA